MGKPKSSYHRYLRLLAKLSLILLVSWSGPPALGSQSHVIINLKPAVSQAGEEEHRSSKAPKPSGSKSQLQPKQKLPKTSTSRQRGLVLLGSQLAMMSCCYYFFKKKIRRGESHYE